MIPREKLKVGLIVRLLNGRGSEHPVGVVREIRADENTFVVQFPDFEWDLSTALDTISNLLEPSCPGLGSDCYEEATLAELKAHIEALRTKKLKRLSGLIEGSARNIGSLAARNERWEKEVASILGNLEDSRQ